MGMIADDSHKTFVRDSVFNSIHIIVTTPQLCQEITGSIYMQGICENSYFVRLLYPKTTIQLGALLAGCYSMTVPDLTLRYEAWKAVT